MTQVKNVLLNVYEEKREKTTKNAVFFAIFGH